MDEDKTITLKGNEHMSIRGENYPEDSLFKDISVFIRNNGASTVTIESTETGFILTVKKI